jgi:hypothetical protein
MITGDHAITAAAIGRQLGLKAEKAVTGDEVAGLDEVWRRNTKDNQIREGEMTEPIKCVKCQVLLLVYLLSALEVAEQARQDLEAHRAVCEVYQTEIKKEMAR